MLRGFLSRPARVNGAKMEAPLLWLAAEVDSVPRVTVQVVPLTAVTSKISESIVIWNCGLARSVGVDATVSVVTLASIAPLSVVTGVVGDATSGALANC